MPQGQAIILNTNFDPCPTPGNGAAGTPAAAKPPSPAGGASFKLQRGRREIDATEAALQQIELTYDETLRALGAALDLRDAETAGHCERVTRYTRQIALQMKCAAEDMVQIARGAYIHDIGKIGIPDSILLKADKLEPNEMEIMKTHVRIGHNLVSHIGFLAPAAEIILTHHENYDGSGYPQGLKGKRIPQGSRIFSIADTLDAMTSDRPYRAARPLAAAKEEIEREAGRQFDPEAVEAFFSIPEQVIQGTVMEERRRFARVGLKTLVVCRLGDRTFFSSCFDVSETGVSLSNANAVEPGQKLAIEFSLPNEQGKITTRAEVVRWEATGRLAARFVGMPAFGRQQICRYIRERVAL